MEPQTGRHALKRWLLREMKDFIGVGLYFYVWFGVILLYKTAVLGGNEVGLAAYGLAIVKALILGKLALIAHAIPLGRLLANRPPLQTAIGKSLFTLVALVALTAIEEAVRGLLHGHSIAEALTELMAGRLFELAATCLLLWLVLIPFYLLRQIAEAMGAGELRRLLLGAPKTPR